MGEKEGRTEKEEEKAKQERLRKEKRSQKAEEDIERETEMEEGGRVGWKDKGREEGETSHEWEVVVDIMALY